MCPPPPLPLKNSLRKRTAIKPGMQGCLSYSQAVACTSLPGQKVTAEQCRTATAAFRPLVKRQNRNTVWVLLFLCSQRASWGGSSLCVQTSRFLFQSDNSLKYLWCHRSTGSCSWRRGTSFVLQCPLMNSSVQTVSKDRSWCPAYLYFLD